MHKRSVPAVARAISLWLTLLLVLALPFALPRSAVLAQTNPPASQDSAPAGMGGQPQGGPPDGLPRRRAMPRPTNLKILPKDIAGPELMKVMHSFQGQLGVECGFCHAPDPATHRLNFASDAKPEKATARIMMRMTADINEKYLTQINDPDHADHPAPPVTCGTCHRGKSMPAAFVLPPEAEHFGGPDDHHDGMDMPPGPPPA